MTTKRLTYIDGKAEWVAIDNYSTGALKRNVLGKDPTIDQHINDKGGIFSHLDNKVYTNKANYLASIKEAGCHIKDY
jgi:hypothetical protein